MTIAAVLLITVSAILHAGWNLLAKSKSPSASLFLVASIAGALLLSPVLVWHRHFLPHIPPRVWGLLAATGLCLCVYYAALAGAYRSGDMSLAYPLARSSPIIVVSVVAFILGRSEQVSGLCILGIVLVIVGCFLIPMRRFGDLSSRNYLNPTCGLALLAAVGTTGYSILDDEALRQLRGLAGVSPGTLQVTLVYACLEATAAALWLLLFVAARRNGRAHLQIVLRRNLGYALLTGAAIYTTYGMVLVSLAFVANVSYVVAFRQLSIPLGAALGIIVLGEPAALPKLVGVSVMFAGLLLVAVG